MNHKIHLCFFFCNILSLSRKKERDLYVYSLGILVLNIQIILYVLLYNLQLFIVVKISSSSCISHLATTLTALGSYNLYEILRDCIKEQIFVLFSFYPWICSNIYYFPDSRLFNWLIKKRRKILISSVMKNICFLLSWNSLPVQQHDRLC